MFRPPSLLASQIVPTAAHIAAEQLRLLRPSRACFVTSHASDMLAARIGNWRHGDSHPARFAALSAAPLCLRFNQHLAMPPARLEARMDSLLSFPVGLFHPLQHAGCSENTSSGRKSSGIHNADFKAETPQTTQMMMRAADTAALTRLALR